MSYRVILSKGNLGSTRIKQVLCILFCISTIWIKVNAQDSLGLSVAQRVVFIDSKNWGIELNIESPDPILYEIVPENIIPSVNSETYVCSLKKPGVYVFLYDFNNEIIWPQFHYRCESYYRDFAKSLRLEKKLKICLLDYPLGPGKYKIQLLFYSDNLDLCLYSRKAEFQVLP